MTASPNRIRVNYITLYSERWRAELIESGQEPMPEYMYFARYSTFDVVHQSLGGEAETPLKRYRLLAALRDNDSILTAHIDTNSCDCIIAAGENVGLALLTRTSRPLLIFVHGFSEVRNVMSEQALLRDNVHYLFLSDTLRTRLTRLYNLPPERTHNVGYSVDDNFFSASAEKPRPGLIVAAGSGNRDYRTLVSACSDLPLKLMIAHDSTWFPAQHHLDISTLPENVTVASAHTYRNLREWYKQAQFIVVPLEDAPNACGYAVIAEGMAMGKTVIATRTRAASDLIIHMESGIYVPHKDAIALQRAVKFCLGNPDAAAEMGMRARRRIQFLFTHRHFSDRLEAIVRFALGRTSMTFIDKPRE